MSCWSNSDQTNALVPDEILNDWTNSELDSQFTSKLESDVARLMSSQELNQFLDTTTFLNHVEQGTSSENLQFLNGSDLEMAPNVFEQDPLSGNFSNGLDEELCNQASVPHGLPEQSLQLPPHQPDMGQQQLFQYEQPASVAPTPVLYNFRLLKEKYAKVQKFAKSARFLYSKKLNKFFFNVEKPCPVYFKVDCPLPTGCSVVCMAKFKDTRLAGKPLKQCPSHISKSTTDRFVKISGEGSSISYLQSDDGHDLASQSIITTSLANPTEFTVGYEFHCLTSCHKKELSLVFQLWHENYGSLGEFEVDTQVCTCTGRAMETQEDKLDKRLSRKRSASSVSSSPASSLPQSPSTNSPAIAATSPIKIEKDSTLQPQQHPRIKHIGHSSSGKKVLQVRVSKKNQDQLKEFINRMRGLKLIDNNEQVH